MVGMCPAPETFIAVWMIGRNTVFLEGGLAESIKKKARLLRAWLVFAAGGEKIVGGFAGLDAARGVHDAFFDDDVSEEPSSPVDAGPDGSDGGVLEFGDFGVRELFDVAEVDGISVDVGEFVEGGS